MTNILKLNRRSFLFGAAGVAAVSSGYSRFGSAEHVEAERSGEARKALEKSSTWIGNFNAFFPGGIAFIRNRECGLVLNVGWDATGKPGIASPDGSINQIIFRRDRATLHFDWGRVNGYDGVAIRLASDRSTTLTLELPARPWHAMNIAVRSISQNVIEVVCFGPRGQQEVFSLKHDGALRNETAAIGPSGRLSVELDGETPVRLVAGFGELPKIEDVDEYLQKAADRYAASRVKCRSVSGDFANAIADNLNNSRLYSNISKEIAHVIGRGSWIVTDPDYLPYFVWDTSFNSLLASIEDPDGARSTLRTLLSYQLPNGMLPRILNWNHDPEPFIDVKNSNPPVASLCAWRIFERWADYSFLEEVYPKLLKWHDWWPSDRDGNGNGLLEWGATGTLADARLETGWDDTPAFDGAEMVGTQMNVDAVDLNALWAMDAEFLAKMAEVLGLSADAKSLLHDQDRTNRLMNELLWNEELGVYCHRLWDHDGSRGRFLSRLTPMNFYPLISGAPDQSRAKRMLNVLTDPKKFWGSWPIPTLPYNDPEWVHQDYWRGHTWPPVNYLIFQGLKRYASPNEQLYFAKRSVDLFMRNWDSTGTCNETYNSSDGKGDRYPHYTWGALLCQIGLEALLNIDPSGPPAPSAVARLWGDFEIHNIPSGGKLYRVTSGGSSIEVSEAP